MPQRYRNLELKGQARVEQISDTEYRVEYDGAAFGRRFTGWVVVFGLERAPYQSIDDVPVGELRSVYILRLPDGSAPRAFFVVVGSATPPGIAATARTFWHDDHYIDEIRGALPTKQSALAAYQGIELLRLAWPSAGGRPKGMADVTREAFLAEYECMRNEYKEEDTKPPTKADIGDRYGVSDDTIRRFCNEQHPPITWPPKQ